MKARHRDAERARRERLDRDIVEAQEELVEARDRLANEDVKVARLKALIEDRSALLRQVEARQRERIEAELAARSLEKRVEYQRRRLERLGSREDGPRRGRPIRIEVDDDAWAVVKAEAVRRRYRLVDWVGGLVRTEVDAIAADQVSSRPALRRRRSPGEGDPIPRSRFLRIDVDDDCWLEVRSAALALRMSAGRYVGELVEAEAHAMGWRVPNDARPVCSDEDRRP